MSRMPATTRQHASPTAWLAGYLLAVAGAPVAGLAVSAGLPDRYFAFPPHSDLYIEHAAYSTWGMLLTAAGIVLALCASWWLFGGFRLRLPSRVRSAPRWSAGAGVLLLLAWLFAWSRCELFAQLQLHSFIFLWLSYILCANALCTVVAGEAPLMADTRRYLLLFPFSAVVWWLFEWLNRFVQNWTYHNVESFSAPGYLAFASLSFSTVLPAMYVTKLTLDRCLLPTKTKPERRLPALGKGRAAALTLAALIALALLPVYPSLLYPTVWLSPLLLFLGMQRLCAAAPVSFDGPTCWRWMLAALICGVFWELWNFYSLAKWIYHIPYVQAFHVFEMPFLGYAGYLPFGILCGLLTEQFIADINKRSLDEHPAA